MPPNIIVICADQMRADVVGASTPNIMHLADRGVRFMNAYCASPLCQPSRASLITGLYPSQTGICGNQSPPLNPALRDDTFMNHLRRAGYSTALIGKHHYIDWYGLGVDVTANDEEVRRYGFDSVIQVVDDGENLLNDDRYTKYLHEKGLLEEFRTYDVVPNHNDCHFRHPFDEDSTVDGFIGAEGVRFVEEQDVQTPFYLFLSFVGPHPPLWHSNDLMHLPTDMVPPICGSDDDYTRTKRAHYMDRCAYIDSYVGNLLAALKTRGMLDNTWIVFTSDHGDMLGDHGIWDKRFMYDASVKVPLVITGPGMAGMADSGRLDGPRVSRALVSHLDLYPTILSIAGVEDADAAGAGRSGRSLLAMLEHVPGSFRSQVFAELATTMMIRTPNWKLVFDPQQGGVQYLFNLASDADERENLAGRAGYESVASDLIRQMLAHKIQLTQYTHIKEEQRLQRVHVGL